MNPEMTRLTENDHVADLLGIHLLKVDAGYALAEMELRDDFLNGAGGLHGGIIFTLADYVFAVACNSGGIPTVAVNANISFFKPARGKTVTAEAREVSSGRKICSVEVSVYDEEKTMIARFSGTGYRKSQITEG